MGDAVIGTVTAHMYSAAHPSQMNKDYVAAFEKANNFRPNFMSVGGYDGMHLIYEALKKTNGDTDGDKLIAAMKGMKWESPRGPISIDPDTRDIVQNIYIRKVEKVDGKLYNRVRDLRGREGSGEGGEEVAANAVPRLRRSRRRLLRCAPYLSPLAGEGQTEQAALMLTILFDGIAYGMLLFVRGVRARGHARADELRQSRAWRIRHGGRLHHRHPGQPPRPAVPRLAAARLRVHARSSACVLERTLYVHVYAKSHLEQVLFTIGLVFMSVAAVDYVMGSQQQFVAIPSYLQGQINLFGVGIGRYRLLIILVCGLLTVALQFALASTRFGSRLRAAVDDARVARGLGINVNAVFAVTFAVGSGLAGLGGALGAEILGLDPHFPLKFMIYFLIVVTVGGTSSITGPFIASLAARHRRRRRQVLRAASSARSSSTSS